MRMSEAQKPCVVVLVGNAMQFWDFVKHLPGVTKTYRGRLSAETEEFVYRGFGDPDLTDGLSPVRVITVGSFYRRFTPDDVRRVAFGAEVQSWSWEQSALCG